MLVMGIVLLALSLVTRHLGALHGEPWIIVCEWCRVIFNVSEPVPTITFWGGSILVIVGLGRILFIEDSLNHPSSRTPFAGTIGASGKLLVERPDCSEADGPP